MILSTQNLLDLTERSGNPAAVLNYFLTSGFDISFFAGLFTESAVSETAETPYKRRILGVSEGCEIMVAKWTPNQVCSPHDHGQSEGWVFFLKGNFIETSYKFSQNNLIETGRQSFSVGQHAEIKRADVHSCVCDTDGYSLHVYFPPIHKMKVFDLELRKTYVVQDDCGAWLPKKNTDIVEQILWSPDATTQNNSDTLHHSVS